MSLNLNDLAFYNEDDFISDNEVFSSEKTTTSSPVTYDFNDDFVDPVDTELLQSRSGSLPYTNEYSNMISLGMASVPNRKKFQLQRKQLIIGLVGNDIERGPVLNENVKSCLIVFINTTIVWLIQVSP